MDYKTLATVYRSPENDRALLESAIAMAEARDAHLNVLALGTDRTQPGVYFAGAEAMALRAAMDDAIEDARIAEEAARDRLRNTTAPWEVTGAVAQIGGMAQIVARRANLADLVILPRPYGESRTPEDVAIVEAALFSTRTPVVILPPAADNAPAARNIVVAWNQSAEALAAIRAALPLLKAADSVNVAIIDPPTHDADRSDPGGQLAELLSRHGVRCDISVLARTMPRISDVLLRHVDDTSADFVVMGAYGHSRFREAILGGATRNMLEAAEIPILMAH
jgi:nucleotide-binding universal stress UspA family protein